MDARAIVSWFKNVSNDEKRDLIGQLVNECSATLQGEIQVNLFCYCIGYLRSMSHFSGAGRKLAETRLHLQFASGNMSYRFQPSRYV